MEFLENVELLSDSQKTLQKDNFNVSIDKQELISEKNYIKDKKHITFTEEEYFKFRQGQEILFGEGLPKMFAILSNGIYSVSREKQSDEQELYVFNRISGYLEIKANIHDLDNNNWGFLVEYFDLENKRHETIIRRDSFVGKVPCGQDCISFLSKRGFYIGNEESLMFFFKQFWIKTTKVEITQTGWNEGCFGLPNLTIGKNNNTFFNIKSLFGYNCSGVLSAWTEQIGKYCEGNPKLIFAVSCAFAAPLLRLCGLEGGGFHFYGQSSCGKTTLLRVATSVCGGPDYMQNWRATSNGLESVAESHNDTLLVLDEIGQADSTDIGDTIYMLANGLGKVRSTTKGTPKNVKKWLNLFLSTGELDLESHMRTARKTAKDGQEVRCLSIPAMSETSKYGIFDNIYSFSNGSDFADYFISQTKKYYGIPLLVFLSFLVQYLSNIKNEFDTYLAEQKTFFGKGLTGLANRALNRFALVGFAGEKATEWGITGWEKGSATNAIRQLFNEWNDNPERMSDLDKLKQQVRLFLEKDPEYKISPYFSDLSLQGREQWITPERFRTDVIRGLDASWAVKELVKLGWINPGNSKDRYTQKRRIDKNGVYRGVYVFDIIRVFGDGFLNTQTENV